MAIVQSVFVSNVCDCVRVLESSRKLFCVTNVCALCLSPRQRGNRGRQCGGEGERSLPAHYRQSADAFRTVTQTGTTCLNPYRHTHKDIEDAMYSENVTHSHIHCNKITVPAAVPSGL